MTVSIAEQFHSIQGEGPYAGTTAIFLRLAGCNLTCGWDQDVGEYEPGAEPRAAGANWVCDTIDVWRDAEVNMAPDDLATEWRARGWLELLERGAHLVVTGGEPTLPAHQEAVTDLVVNLPPDTFVEVETNGTQQLDRAFTRVVDHFNVSLKLSNSGMERDRRLDADAIEQYTAMDPPPGEHTAMFKFVVADEADIREVDQVVTGHDIPDAQVSLMPAGQTAEALRQTYPVAAEAAKTRTWDFSPRLQVDVWGQVTGV